MTAPRAADIGAKAVVFGVGFALDIARAILGGGRRGIR